MEPRILDEWAEKRRLTLSPEKKERLLQYAHRIHCENKRYNITGHKTMDEILQSLIIGSIDPILGIEVPCGTRFVDAGSGAGIPGIPLGIFYEGFRGLLIESQRKKAAFIERSIGDLHLDALAVQCGRVEDAARSVEYRESFDFAFSRGYAELFVVLETTVPLVKRGGLLFVYSKEKADLIDPGIVRHVCELGAEIEGISLSSMENTSHGLCVRKKDPTPMSYPRRFPVIKRESRRFGRTVSI